MSMNCQNFKLELVWIRLRETWKEAGTIRIYLPEGRGLWKAPGREVIIILCQLTSCRDF